MKLGLQNEKYLQIIDELLIELRAYQERMILKCVKIRKKHSICN